MLNAPKDRVSAVILGIMQDGGLPHIGCRCKRCLVAYEDPRMAEYAACLGIVDRRTEPGKVWLVDATPDIKYQLNLVGDYLAPHPGLANRLRQPDGILLTHAHMGHIAGLSQFGPATMVVRQLQIFASSRLVALLRDRDPYDNAREFDFVPLEHKVPVKLAPGLQIIPMSVPHRDEQSVGTFAFLFLGPERSLLYVPDIDNWESLAEVEGTLFSVDYALVDATFYSDGEIGGRPPITHPLIPTTITRFAGINTRLVLTHLNHTNPVLDEGSPERKSVLEAGVEIAETNQVFLL